MLLFDILDSGESLWSFLGLGKPLCDSGALYCYCVDLWRGYWILCGYISCIILFLFILHPLEQDLWLCVRFLHNKWYQSWVHVPVEVQLKYVLFGNFEDIFRKIFLHIQIEQIELCDLKKKSVWFRYRKPPKSALEVKGKISHFWSYFAGISQNSAVSADISAEFAVYVYIYII